MPGPGLLVHVGALVQCPHQAHISVTPSSRVMVNGTQAVLTTKDIHSISGCPFQVPAGPGTKPQPCVSVQLEPSARVTLNGMPAVILTSTTMCKSAEGITQGPPNSSPIQKRVTAL